MLFPSVCSHRKFEGMERMGMGTGRGGALLVLCWAVLFGCVHVGHFRVYSKWVAEEVGGEVSWRARTWEGGEEEV